MSLDSCSAASEDQPRNYQKWKTANAIGKSVLRVVVRSPGEIWNIQSHCTAQWSPTVVVYVAETDQKEKTIP